MLLNNFVNKTCVKCGKDYQLMESFSFRESICIECQCPESNKNDVQEIRILPELIDTSKLYSNEKKLLWRPESFEQYQGQESLKNILQGYLKGCKQLNRPFPHFLISGKAGGGKTAIAYILAHQLGLNFIECVANTLKSPQQLVDKLVSVNGGVLFIDELQVIPKNIANFILPLMEDFSINGTPIKPFTLISATTELGILLKKYRPLVDRFKINKTLDAYTDKEIANLLKQYKEKSFSSFKILDEEYLIIAKNSRKTPRIAIRLLESYIYMNKPLKEIFKTYNIVKDGLTEDDIKILRILDRAEKGLGLISICAFLQTSMENYIYSIESYLIEQGLITISTRRNITVEGKQLLESLK